MGFIYVIICNVNKKLYVGQTTRPIAARWEQHCAAARKMARHLADPVKYPTAAACRALAAAMAKYGIENFQIIELRDVPDIAEDGTTLDDEEIYWIAELGSLTPNGYNLTLGGNGGEWSQESKDKLSATRADHIEETRHEKLEGLPVHFTYRNYPGLGEQIVLFRHPLLHPATKCFSVKEHGTFEAARQAALEFVDKLEAKEIVVEERKTRWEPGIPKPIYAKDNGYGYQKTIDGKKYQKQFTRAEYTKEQNLQLTIDHYNELMIQHNLPEIHLQDPENIE